jgi:hypothetical protein
MKPDLDGSTVCRLLRGDPTLGRIPLGLITALDDDASRLEGLRAGADDFVAEPCRREELRARVRTIASLNRFRSIAEHRVRFDQRCESSPRAIGLADAVGGVSDANPAAKVLLAIEPARGTVRTALAVCFDSGGSGGGAGRHQSGAGRRPHVRPVRYQPGFWARHAGLRAGGTG